METGTIIFIGLLLIATELVYRSPILNFLCTQHFDLPEREIKEAVKVFTPTTNPSLQSLQTLQSCKSTEQQTPQEDYLKATPTIPEELYLQMPEILQHGAMAFTDERERDVFSYRCIGNSQRLFARCKRCVCR